MPDGGCRCRDGRTARTSSRTAAGGPSHEPQKYCATAKACVARGGGDQPPHQRDAAGASATPVARCVIDSTEVSCGLIDLQVRRQRPFGWRHRGTLDRGEGELTAEDQRFSRAFRLSQSGPPRSCGQNGGSVGDGMCASCAFMHKNFSHAARDRILSRADACETITAARESAGTSGPRGWLPSR